MQRGNIDKKMYLNKLEAEGVLTLVKLQNDSARAIELPSSFERTTDPDPMQQVADSLTAQLLRRHNRNLYIEKVYGRGLSRVARYCLDLK